MSPLQAERCSGVCPYLFVAWMLAPAAKRSLISLTLPAAAASLGARALGAGAVEWIGEEFRAGQSQQVALCALKSRTPGGKQDESVQQEFEVNGGRPRAAQPAV
eukprot:CAMPEP_0175834438 /NCGR_PEP_ID=MMETSP0107_2-20121207/16056_1 /TAXON_ID=195067 ORGANISM="Goniomonas pacifica, Strain CCMP1869" /NCGR_SAMPLE_ID=MMETSP0107_2 /ASSEMBLY_ACC=CAM_ASM_000203 /LENGTH=103 /DNA_ID=CAMNT_0017147659 /DNA_START=860 /DNA_END=1172 /DNA_ORIENTATION=-